MKKDSGSTKERQKTRGGKLGTVFGTILCIILIPILIVNVTMIIKGVAHSEKYPTFLGYAPMIVLTDSMYPSIKSGDLIIIKTVDPEEVQVGDVISFFDPDSSTNSVVTHRVVRIDRDNGLSFITKGDANNAEDTPLPAANLVGRYQSLIPGAGSVAMFLQTTPGLVVCVALPMVLLIAYELIRRRKYSKSKEEDTQALLAELEALRARQAEADAKAAEARSDDPEA